MCDHIRVKEGCLTRSRTFKVKIIAPAARTANATTNTSDYKDKQKSNQHFAQKEPHKPIDYRFDKGQQKHTHCMSIRTLLKEVLCDQCNKEENTTDIKVQLYT